jgi:hypothetical protein
MEDSMKMRLMNKGDYDAFSNASDKALINDEPFKVDGIDGQYFVVDYDKEEQMAFVEIVWANEGDPSIIVILHTEFFAAAELVAKAFATEFSFTALCALGFQRI